MVYGRVVGEHHETVEEKTGFDILKENKENGIKAVEELVLHNEGIDYDEISKKTGLSKRTISRYMAIIRKKYVKSAIKTNYDKMLEGKRKRIEKLRKLVYQHPDYSQAKLAKELGVSERTLKGYIKQL